MYMGSSVIEAGEHKLSN